MPKDSRDPDNGEDDAAAFAEAVRGARKLGGVRRVAAPLGGAGSRLGPVGIPRSPPSSFRPPISPLTVVQTGETWTARADGVDWRIVRRLRDGGIPVEARVDLHGLTRAKAAEVFDRFLTASRAAGRRCLLVIHGRGLHSGPDGPALRDVVRDALTTGAHAGIVLACGSAPGASGGPGATIAYLRR